MHRSQALARLRRLRGTAGVVVLGLLCRALIPVGFMPAAFGAGGPVVVCHGGLAGEFFRRLEATQVAQTEASAPAAGQDSYTAHGSHAGRAGHDASSGRAGPDAHGDNYSPVGSADPSAPDGHAPAAEHEGWGHCPFGAAFGVALLAGDVAPELPDLEDALAVSEPALPVPYRPVSSYRARAPPSSAIHS